MPPTTIRVDLKERSYDIAIGAGDWPGCGSFIRERNPGKKAVVIHDEHVRPHAANVASALAGVGFDAVALERPAGEAQKSLHVAAELYDRLVDMRADRRTLIVAVGGGVMGDLAGFVAATFNRGLPLLMVPTTLLAMVDSSVGGKVGVNHPRGKNLIGAFHQPIGVWIDTETLTTLPEREFRSGLAEVVKYGVILDAEFFAFLEANVEAILARQPKTIQTIVARCCRLKADVVEQDEHEWTGVRAALNYGHTFAHAFETASGYSGWLHGEAVAAGMICASRLAERRRLISAGLTERQVRLLEQLGLPVKPERWNLDGLLSTMRSDKKAMGGKMRFILPRRLGEVALFDDVPEEDVRASLAESLS